MISISSRPQVATLRLGIQTKYADAGMVELEKRLRRSGFRMEQRSNNICGWMAGGDGGQRQVRRDQGNHAVDRPPASSPPGSHRPVSAEIRCAHERDPDWLITPLVNRDR